MLSEEIRIKLLSLSTRLEQLEVIFDLENKRQRITDFSRQMSEAGFWNNEEKSRKIVRELKLLKAAIEPWEKAFIKFQELKELFEMAEAKDRDLIADLEGDLNLLTDEINAQESIALLGGEFDSNNAILSINAGAGGTESCDWVSMLLRMYVRWAERKNCAVATTDILYGEEAGIKNVTILISGPFAYGYLKAEKGVHRLVRISPFDANKRRHTSFASVDVIPEIQEDLDIKIEEKELSIDTFRASGPGGQHMQKSDTAIRITHLPTGLVVQCQNERSQYQNKQTALKILKARLYELERQKNEEKFQKQIGANDKKKIEWGSQIRSYVMHPYSLAKDHRTGYEVGNVAAVMDGELDSFIEAYLKNAAQK
ncbi:MAG: peptide chain release factor 2 [Candidatus Omnitrophota bacterium]